jgi:hypothetical protein
MDIVALSLFRIRGFGLIRSIPIESLSKGISHQLTTPRRLDVEDTRKWISVDLAIGEKVIIGDSIATVLEIDGDQVTIIIERTDYEDSQIIEDAELMTS